MSIYALADLHLSLSNPEKSMELFGHQWAGYLDRITEEWNRTVKPEDTVLIPGDISWATYIEKAEEDFAFIASLPGRKLLSRGNHDYWWTTMKKLDEFFESHSFPGLELVRTNVIESEGCLITGTRGWMTEASKSEDPDKKKIYDRELLRLGLCVDELMKADPGHEKTHILMLHYPPVTSQQDKTEFSEVISEAGIDICVYGHLHGRAHRFVREGIVDGCRYFCVSADYLGFKPVLIKE
ncbi:MAG: serine/threonine protein phosphatase [Ruminococcaceae bacterium]|nr:serine/threonine protein phosphatase [Oscillospiraceae bacterium]